MHSNEFELAFEKFFDSKTYDKASSALFDVTRAAFEAGWLAAGGQPPTPHHIFQVLKKPE